MSRARMLTIGCDMTWLQVFDSTDHLARLAHVVHQNGEANDLAERMFRAPAKDDTGVVRVCGGEREKVYVVRDEHPAGR